MNCLYCDKTCQPHAWDNSYPSKINLQWICKNCNVYIQIFTDVIVRIHWDDIRVGKKTFKVRITPTNEEFTVYIKDDTCPPETWDILFRWDFIPPWSPQSCLVKLKSLFPYL
jgi:hypothetical protein